MREICTSGSTRGRRAADLVRYSSSYSTGNFFQHPEQCLRQMNRYRVEQASACATTFSINRKPQFPSSVRIDSG
jgi:hypothetical protein